MIVTPGREVEYDLFRRLLTAFGGRESRLRGTHIEACMETAEIAAHTLRGRGIVQNEVRLTREDLARAAADGDETAGAGEGF